ncbi:hypothetical protein HMPREF0860_0737 [Treponema socranskii subsp. socranskii VPI DR56BR1116 = ATCC 35536]|uniref:Uncharacterized protein n=1 Tax=Treponema socranskii subsp. socranskii VPI DR56BR1116 = ATCC 35536 TaxID=1125725 RepID=U1GY12_TRESO|nr:hypothetical protein HMPREF1325_2218 [Treponema socranskii subsp. socranskii VPI DR56BR1116 = ATCC 35536]ERK04553.1 hypothetical protein HMPREF0860_0737 [Treponema socranskii subsp. socranskii VPI DR56BR1116 = ATCC 35536]
MRVKKLPEDEKHKQLMKRLSVRMSWDGHFPSCRKPPFISTLEVICEFSALFFNF